MLENVLNANSVTLMIITYVPTVIVTCNALRKREGSNLDKNFFTNLAQLFIR